MNDVKFNIISFTSAKTVVDSFHAIIDSLKSHNISVNHMGLASDLWYAGNAFSAYSFMGYEAFQLPRVSGKKVKWWKEPNIINECIQSLESIYFFINEVIDNKSPNLFLFADDQGPIEKFIVKIFNAHQIPVVLLLHGEIPVEFNSEKPWIDKYAAERKETDKTRWINDCFSINPPGFNGDYSICSYSGFTTVALICNGIHISRIKDTGYPFWDILYNLRNVPRMSSSEERKRILFVSGGWAMFNRQKAGATFFDFFINSFELLRNDYQIYLRLKPKECLTDSLDVKQAEQLNNLPFLYDDNSVASYEATQKYDLIIGDSTFLLESLLLNKPTIYFKNYDVKLQPGNLRCFDFLDLLTVNNLDYYTNIQAIVKKAFTADYLLQQEKEIQKNEKYLFHKFDGKAGYRVGQVLLEAMNTTRK